MNCFRDLTLNPASYSAPPRRAIFMCLGMPLIAKVHTVPLRSGLLNSLDGRITLANYPRGSVTTDFYILPILRNLVKERIIFKPRGRRSNLSGQG